MRKTYIHFRHIAVEQEDIHKKKTLNDNRRSTIIRHVMKNSDSDSNNNDLYDKHSNRRRTGNNSFQTSMDAYVLQYHQYGKTLGTSYRDMYESIT